MPDLYGVGCTLCNREIAAAYKEAPHMEGFLSADEYMRRYGHLPRAEMPNAYVDGVEKPHTIWTVQGDDGWLLCMTAEMIVCHCTGDPRDLRVELWRGKVEVR